MVGNGENGGTNGEATMKMLSLEIEANGEEEHHSLLMETTDEDANGKKNLFMGRNSQGMRRRQWGGDAHGGKSPGAMNVGVSMIQGFLRTDVMSHAVYHLRNALVLGILAFFVLVVLEWEGGVLRSEVMEEEDRVSPHRFSFGGKNNRGHALEPVKTLTADEEADLEDEILDEGVELSSTWDLAKENKLNEEGHYLHDPEKSPFSSSLYLALDDELDTRQRQFAKRRQEIADEFGVWQGFEEAIGLEDKFFEDYYYRDVPTDDFPPGVWQTDEDYIRTLLDEAQSLVEATKEGIMGEYNHPNPEDDEKALFEVIIGDHHEFVNGTATHHETNERLPGVAYLPEKAWDGLIKKLLHAMVTSDHFYVVVAGTDETYKANNFAKSQVMQFNHIMEPVFDKLGMTLISRNMGMSASTAVSALGGADILGETDILWHVQRTGTEEKPGEFDLLQKQAIMSGERVPIVLSPQWDELMQASKGKAWVGNIQPGEDFCQQTTMEVLPDAPACHNVHCDTKAWENRECYVYDSVCWELRSDWNPVGTHDDVGDQDKDHPGYRRHQLEGRKMTLLVLHALNAAIEMWRTNLDDDRSPLPLSTELWHVGGVYEDIREAVMSLDRIAGEAAAIPACEMLLKDVDARICHVPMHAYTEWTPRVIPQRSGLLSIVNNLVVGGDGEPELYDGPDIVPVAWQVPEDEVDVHMIAIAANVTPGYDDDIFGGAYLDDDWDGYGYDDDLWNGTDDDDEFTRRLQENYVETGQLRDLRGQGQAQKQKGTEESAEEVKADQGNNQENGNNQGNGRGKRKGKRNKQQQPAQNDKNPNEKAPEADEVPAPVDECKGRKKNRGKCAGKGNQETAEVPVPVDECKGRNRGKCAGKGNQETAEVVDECKGKRNRGKCKRNNNAEKAAVPVEEEVKAPEGKKKGRGRGKGNGNANVATDPPGPTPKEYSGEWLEIAEGAGWRLSDAPVGFCDGSAQSRCNRQSENMCLLANHNHYKGNVVGSPKNSWLTMQVPGVRHGIILARLTFEGSNGSPYLPTDLLFDYAVNGVVTTVKGSELQNFSKTLVNDLTVYPFVKARSAVVDGDEFGVDFDIAIRIRSNIPDCAVRLSHIYFA